MNWFASISYSRDLRKWWNDIKKFYKNDLKLNNRRRDGFYRSRKASSFAFSNGFNKYDMIVF